MKFEQLVQIMVDADLAMLEGRPPEPELGVPATLEKARAEAERVRHIDLTNGATLSKFPALRNPIL